MNENDELNKVFSFQGEMAKYVPFGDGIKTVSVATKENPKCFHRCQLHAELYLSLIFK